MIVTKLKDKNAAMTTALITTMMIRGH